MERDRLTSFPCHRSGKEENGSDVRLANNGLANWDAEFAAEPGVTMSAECKRVLLGAKQGVQKHFDLV